jgi:hypothetical protein
VSASLRPGGCRLTGLGGGRSARPGGCRLSGLGGGCGQRARLRGCWRSGGRWRARSLTAWRTGVSGCWRRPKGRCWRRLTRIDRIQRGGRIHNTTAACRGGAAAAGWKRTRGALENLKALREVERGVKRHHQG